MTFDREGVLGSLLMIRRMKGKSSCPAVSAHGWTTADRSASRLTRLCVAVLTQISQQLLWLLSAFQY
jgi:hypothetical protein